MSQTKITTDNINTLDAAMLTGSALPALNGAALTNVPGVTNSASDPLISTNPSAVGAAWLNTTTGNLFCCTDKTAGANVWINVGSGSGDVKKLPLLGTVAGFTMGGWQAIDTIDKFSLTSQSNATDHGNLTTARGAVSGTGSSTHGYTQGGSSNGSTTFHNIIDKFAFASAGNATDHGDLSVARYYASGHSSATHGFAATGSPVTNVIDKYSFSSGTTAADHGDAASSKRSASGASSETQGFISAGFPNQNTIEKFNFASTGNATDHGDLAYAGHAGGANSSETHGHYGGYNTSNSMAINRYAFSSNVTATGHGNLFQGSIGCTAQNSTSDGYISGSGVSPWGSQGNQDQTVIQKFPFASAAGSADHADLSLGRQDTAGTQY